MFLAIDVGNTNTNFTIFRAKNSLVLQLHSVESYGCSPDDNAAKSIIGTFKLQTDYKRECDEYMALLSTLFDNAKIDLSKIDAVGVSCVVAPVLDKIIAFIRKYLKKESFILSAQDQKILDLSRLCRPEALGADLISAAIASVMLYNSQCIVIDCGTATTISLIFKTDGIWRYDGTVITLGLSATSKAIKHFIPALSNIDVNLNRPALYGRDTGEAIAAGLYHGHIGMIKHITTTLQKVCFQDIKQKCLTIITGGAAKILLHEIDFVDIYNPHLVEIGVKFGYEMR